MATIADCLTDARSEVGYVEAPPNSNRTKFAAEAGHANGHYWCATYTAAILKRCGVRCPKGVYTASTRANKAAWQAAGRWVEPADIQPGDVVFFHLTNRNGTNPNVPDHTGFALNRKANHTVEGNTSSGDQGDQTNGGGVYERHRPFAKVIGAGRPWYSDYDQPTPPHEPPAPEEVMKLLRVVEGPDKDSIWLQRGDQLLLMRPDEQPPGSGDTAQARNSGAIPGDIEEPLWSYLKAHSDVVVP